MDKEWDEIARRTDELIANARESKGVVAVSQDDTAASRSFKLKLLPKPESLCPQDMDRHFMASPDPIKATEQVETSRRLSRENPTVRKPMRYYTITTQCATVG